MDYCDKFDKCDAYYLFYVLYHEGQWSDKYRKLCSLLKVYKPSPLLHTEEDLQEGAREFFWELERREFNKKKRV